MKSTKVLLSAAERRKKIVDLAAAWRRRAVEKRCSIAKLAEKMGCAERSARRAISNNISKRCKKVHEKVEVLRVKKGVPAAQLRRDLGVKCTAERTVRRLRQATRTEVLRERRLKREANFIGPEKIRKIVGAPQGYEASQRSQGW